MNIFYLDKDPKTCARMHCDKHVVKMIIEYAQLMSTAHRVLDGDPYVSQTLGGRRIQRWKHPLENHEKLLYKASHVNHPSGKWVRESQNHYNWLYKMWEQLCYEYTHRYGRVHLTDLKLRGILAQPPMQIPVEPFGETVWYRQIRKGKVQENKMETEMKNSNRALAHHLMSNKRM